MAIISFHYTFLISDQLSVIRCSIISKSIYPNSQQSDRIPGRLRGQCTVTDDFYQTDQELITLFEG